MSTVLHFKENMKFFIVNHCTIFAFILYSSFAQTDILLNHYQRKKRRLLYLNKLENATE